MIDEFLIRHGMTHPPLWAMWAVIIYVPVIGSGWLLWLTIRTKR